MSCSWLSSQLWKQRASGCHLQDLQGCDRRDIEFRRRTWVDQPKSGNHQPKKIKRGTWWTQMLSFTSPRIGWNYGNLLPAFFFRTFKRFWKIGYETMQCFGVNNLELLPLFPLSLPLLLPLPIPAACLHVLGHASFGSLVKFQEKCQNEIHSFWRLFIYQPWPIPKHDYGRDCKVGHLLSEEPFSR